MNRIGTLVALLSGLVLVPPVGGQQPDAPVTLVVEVEGLRSDKGSVALALFDDQESFDSRSDPVRAEYVSPDQKRCTWVVDDLAPGSYALVAYHDRNDNGELDRRKAFGIPTEPYGFSNDARGKFGPPSFEAARFEIGGGQGAITVRLR